MTPQEVEKYFQYHNSNMKLIEIGFDQIKNQLKSLYLKKIKSGAYIYTLDDNNIEKVKFKQAEKSLNRILSGVQVSWLEESLKRLLYESKLLTEGQRQYLIERPALEQKWQATLRLVFCIAYGLVPASDETCKKVNVEGERWNLGDEIVNQYFEMWNLIKDYLIPNFLIRNKVQHGEWEFAFKPKFSAEYSQEITDSLNKENLITTTSRFNLVDTFYHSLVEMGRFRSNNFALDSMATPFEYFYKVRMRKIEFEKVKIHNSDLHSYISSMIDKEVRGSSYRSQNNASA